MSPVFLPELHERCIWCGESFTSVRRSNEHIIPESLFGRIVTLDVCVGCNNRLGAEVDCAFLCDGPTIEAAREAGFPPERFLTRYRTRSVSARGLEIVTTVSGETSAVVPNFRDPNGSLVGDRNGVFDQGQLQHQKSLMLARILSKGVVLARETIIDRIEALYARAESSAGMEVWDKVLGEGLCLTEHTPTHAQGSQADPVLVSRGAGKMLYQFLRTLPPIAVQQEMAGPVTELKAFVENRANAADVVGYKR